MAKPDNPVDRSVYTIQRQQGTERHTLDDCLAVEEPLEIRLGYTDRQRGRVHKSVSITMRTPGHDAVLALGFLYSEGIINQAAQVQHCDTSRANVVRVELAEDVVLDLGRLERHFYTTSSCGVCGKASLEALSMEGAEAIRQHKLQVDSATLYHLGQALRQAQDLFHDTGGNHAAGLFDASGQIQLLMEDVGRHNAMDKLIGSLLQQQHLPLESHGIVVSGRASFELMQKALMARCPMLVAVGAPSSLAVELAQEFDMSLVGFLGRERFNIYHGGEHIHP